MKINKIKVGVSLPRKPTVVIQEGYKAGRQVSMNVAGPVFKNHPFLEFFWDKHPTPAAIDAAFLYLTQQKRIRINPGSPVLPQVLSRKEKLNMIRAAMEGI